MATVFNGYRTINPIFKVNWMGWRSDTLTLQKYGWNFAMQDITKNGFSVFFVIRHPEMKIYGRTNKIILDTIRGQSMQSFRDIELNVAMQLAAEITFQQCDPPKLMSMDMEPVCQHISSERFKLSETWPFEVAVPEHEIIVDPVDVNKMLDMILNEQRGKQAEIRDKNRKQAKRIHANIVTLKEVA